MTKVIFLIHSLGIGGSENLFLHILPNIKNVDATLITLRHKGLLHKKFLSLGIKVQNINQRNFFDLGSYRRAKNIFDEIKPDIVITNLSHADFFGRFFIQYFLKYRVVPYLVSTLNFKRFLPVQIFERLTKYFVTEYIANSYAVKNSYIKNYGVIPHKIIVIQGGIDLKRFNLKPNNLIRDDIKILKNHKIITCVANFHINKGHIYLINAFNKIASKYKIQLLLVGDGDTRQELEKYVETLPSKDKIIFLGTRSDVLEILKLSDIFVLPTFFEGLSFAILEAMASQLAIIATNIPENKELIKHNYSGLLCPVGDSNCLASKIEFLINNKKKASEFALNAFNIVNKRYAIEVIIKKWKRYLRKY